MKLVRVAKRARHLDDVVAGDLDRSVHVDVPGADSMVAPGADC